MTDRAMEAVRRVQGEVCRAMPTGQPAQRGSAAGPRGFTLLELLVVLGLLLAIAGVVLPMMFSRLQSSVFDETVRQVDSALALCRTDARLAGQPVRLVAITHSDSTVELVGLAIVAGAELSPRGGDLSAEQASLDPQQIAEPDTGEGSGLGRRYLTLPRGYRVARDSQAEQLMQAISETASVAEGFVPVPEPGAGPDAMAGDLDASQPLTIAVFLPDGSALTEDPVRLIAPNGAMLTISIGPWSGRATLEVGRQPDPLLADDPMQDLLPDEIESDQPASSEPGP